MKIIKGPIRQDVIVPKTGINLVIFPFTPRPQFLHTILFGPWATQKSQNAQVTGTMMPWAPRVRSPYFSILALFAFFTKLCQSQISPPIMKKLTLLTVANGTL